jgi:hypothetical protein
VPPLPIYLNLVLSGLGTGKSPSVEAKFGTGKSGEISGEKSGVKNRRLKKKRRGQCYKTFYGRKLQLLIIS